MARKNEFEKTKETGIYTLKKANGSTEFYATFRFNNELFLNKNLTLYGIRTLKQAKDELENIKAELRKGENRFLGGIASEKVEHIVLESITARKPKKNPDKDNAKYKHNLKLFYYSYIHPTIGHLKPEKVMSTHVDKILANLKKSSKGHKLNVHVLMFNLFETRLRKKEIDENPFYGIDYGKHEYKKSFDVRLNETMEEASIKLYMASLEYVGPHKLLFVLSIMLARRIGEIHQLKYSHIKKYSDGTYYILTTPDITKTGIEEKFPLPDEVVELLPDEILDPQYANQQLFYFCYSAIFQKYNNLVAEAEIKLNNNETITSHDNRHLFISILAGLGVNPDLADSCLSHNNKKTTKDIYLQVPYERRKEIFTKWWTFLREGAEKVKLKETQKI